MPARALTPTPTMYAQLRDAVVAVIVRSSDTSMTVGASTMSTVTQRLLVVERNVRQFNPIA